jgi:uncharacterized protein YjlB
MVIIRGKVRIDLAGNNGTEVAEESGEVVLQLRLAELAAA